MSWHGREGMRRTLGSIWLVTVLGLLATACSVSSESTMSSSPGESPTVSLELEADGLRVEVEDLKSQLARALQDLEEESTTLRETRIDLVDVAAELDSSRALIDEVSQLMRSNLDSMEAEQRVLEMELRQLRELAPLPDSPAVQGAVVALEQFLSAMRENRFSDAAELFGGDLTSVLNWNPGVDSADLASVLESACSQLRCDLEVRRILPGLISDDSYRFHVEFLDRGQLFTLGPCCGDTSGASPETTWAFQVVWMPDGYQVMTLPVYVP